MKNKKHIAMRCNQEQFEAIKPKLERAGYEFDICDFKRRSYLCVHLENEKLIANYSKDGLDLDKRIIHEQWNEKIFLEAFGIETIPTLEEVKERFKDAETVESVYGNTFVISNIYYNSGVFIASEKKKEFSKHTIWNSKKGYAKILTYKTKKFEITKEQVLLLHKDAKNDTPQLVTADLEQWFPEVFEVKLPDDFTGWAKTNNIGNEKWISKFENGLQKYGIDANGYWLVYESKNYIENNMYEATPEEVTEALKKEAVRLGFVHKAYIRDFNNNLKKLDTDYITSYDKEMFWHGGYCIMKNGIWATVIKTKTIQQAEELLKELGHEIKIVS